jgi:hypothetical protein
MLKRFAIRSFLLLQLPFILFFSPSCAGRSPVFSSPPSYLPHAPLSKTCRDTYGNHSIFHISVDGIDVGREVRSDFVKEGDTGLERIFISHTVKNERMGTILFPSVVVKSELTSLSSGQLLEADVVQKTQINTNHIHISRNDDGWSRTIDTRGTFSSASSDTSDDLPLNGTETVGFFLYNRLSQIALGKSKSPKTFSFFDILHNAPFDLTVSNPIPDTLSFDEQETHGNWVEVFKKNENSPVARFFFDNEGLLWFEDYPDIHETRRRATGPFSLPSETSELLVGLRSDTYLYDPNIATRATYHLISTPDRLDALSLLDEPLNQTVKRISPKLSELTVHAGAPDQQDPPSAADLGSSLYIKPEDPKVIQAYKYLRSAGKHGSLSKSRRLNATPVIALLSSKIPKNFGPIRTRWRASSCGMSPRSFQTSAIRSPWPTR